MNIIQTENLTKNFGKTTAVDNVSIHVNQGEIYGFLGLNGAGKTTTIRLLLGLIKPDKGVCRLFDNIPEQASESWNKIGYLIETPHSYPDLSVKENLQVIAKLRGIKDPDSISTIITKLQLEKYRDVKEKHLSMGNKQRLGLAKALIHRPRLLLLDEPINGLDPAGIVEIREFLSELVEMEGTTIFLSSHILSEISKLATRIGIVHEGKLIKEIKTQELGEQIIKKLCIDTLNNGKAIQILNEKGFSASIGTDSRIDLNDKNALLHPEKISGLLAESDLAPRLVHVIEEDLESYFLRIIRGATHKI